MVCNHRDSWEWPPPSQNLLGFLMQRKDLAPLLGDTALGDAFAASYNLLSILGALLNRGTPSWWAWPRFECTAWRS